MAEQKGKWAERYVLWAEKHGNTPEQQLEADKKRWPGGSMCGYHFWITEAGDRFAMDINYPRKIAILANQKEFTEFLNTQPLYGKEDQA